MNLQCYSTINYNYNFHATDLRTVGIKVLFDDFHILPSFLAHWVNWPLLFLSNLFNKTIWIREPLTLIESTFCSKGRNAHVPYRDSKLTRILQNSLGGNARTAIICTMSPARSHVEQSRNTLLFASCAKEVSTNARVNLVMSDKVLVKQLQRELARLASEMQNLGSADASKLIREKEKLITQVRKPLFASYKFLDSRDRHIYFSIFFADVQRDPRTD